MCRNSPTLKKIPKHRTLYLQIQGLHALRTGILPSELLLEKSSAPSAESNVEIAETRLLREKLQAGGTQVLVAEIRLLPVAAGVGFEETV